MKKRFARRRRRGVGMVKTLVGCGLAAVFAASLWSTIPRSYRHITAKIRRIEVQYKAALRLGDIE